MRSGEPKETLLEQDKRPYKKLTSEEKDRLILTYKRLLEEGFCAPRLDDSILGLDWSLFQSRVFPEHADDTRFLNPPEFVSIALATLDAYAAAMLAAQWAHDRPGELTFLCRLGRSELNLQLQLEFQTLPERGSFVPRAALLELLATFAGLLRAKNLRLNAYYGQGAGFPLVIPYPGKMIAELSPCLKDRPRGLWPEISLRILPTQDLLSRARGVVKFAQDLDLLNNIPS
jgi:hypothetical protein